MKNNLKFALCSLLTISTIACSKSSNKKSDTASATESAIEPASTQSELTLKNSQNISVQKISDSKYLVVAPSMVINTISLANNPHKSICKEVSKLKHELSALEDKKAEAVSLAQTDNSAEGSVDELAASIEAKSTEIEELTLGKTYEVKVTYSKEKLLKNLEVLKAANPDVSFDVQQPEHVKLSVIDSNDTEQAQQTMDLASKMTAGAFDTTQSDITLDLNINYDVLCTQKSLNSPVNGSNKSKLVMSFN